MVVRKGAAEFSYAGEFVGRVFGEDLHAKRVRCLTNATVGVMTSASLAVSTIGHGPALAQGGLSKHAIKQVLLSAYRGPNFRIIFPTFGVSRAALRRR